MAEGDESDQAQGSRSDIGGEGFGGVPRGGLQNGRHKAPQCARGVWSVVGEMGRTRSGVTGVVRAVGPVMRTWVSSTLVVAVAVAVAVVIVVVVSAESNREDRPKVSRARVAEWSGRGEDVLVRAERKKKGRLPVVLWATRVCEEGWRYLNKHALIRGPRYRRRRRLRNGASARGKIGAVTRMQSTKKKKSVQATERCRRGETDGEVEDDGGSGGWCLARYPVGATAQVLTVR